MHLQQKNDKSRHSFIQLTISHWLRNKRFLGPWPGSEGTLKWIGLRPQYHGIHRQTQKAAWKTMWEVQWKKYPPATPGENSTWEGHRSFHEETVNEPGESWRGGEVKKKPTNTEAGWNKVSKVRDAWLLQKTPGTPCWQSGPDWLKEGAMRLSSHEGSGDTGFALLCKREWLAFYQDGSGQPIRVWEQENDKVRPVFQTDDFDSSTKVHSWGYGIWRGSGRQRVELGGIILVRWKFFDKTWGTLAGIERQK